MVSVRHPSLWVFTVRLKAEERKVMRDIRHLRRGQAVSSRRSNWRRVEERIIGLKRRYTAGTLTIDQYWNAVRFAVHGH